MSRPALALSLALTLPLATAAAAPPLASIEEFARAIGMKPGGWRTIVKVTAADIRPSPAADPASVAEIRERIETQRGVTNEGDDCLDPAEKDLRLPGILIDPICVYRGMRAANGRWALISSCHLPEADQVGTLAGEGTYSPEAVTGRHEGDFSYKRVTVRLKIETSSRYVGECRSQPPVILVPVPPND